MTAKPPASVSQLHSPPSGQPQVPSSSQLDTDERFGAHYAALRRMARSRLRQHETFTLLNTTALVHESYLRLSKAGGVSSADEPAFLAYVGAVMRSVIVDAARARLTQRRGDGVKAESFEDDIADVCSEVPAKVILNVHEALNSLRDSDPRLADVIALQYFGGMTDAEVATTMGLSASTVRRDIGRSKLMLAALLG
jgi:RNA polymerase sigma factor (TIGR02999 family)